MIINARAGIKVRYTTGRKEHRQQLRRPRRELNQGGTAAECRLWSELKGSAERGGIRGLHLAVDLLWRHDTLGGLSHLQMALS